MHLTYHGIFYATPPGDSDLGRDVIHFVNDAGKDFYDLALVKTEASPATGGYVEARSAARAGFVLDPATNEVVGYGNPLDRLAPDGLGLVVTTQLAEADALASNLGSTRYRWTGSTLAPFTPESEVPTSLPKINVVRVLRAHSLWESLKTALNAAGGDVLEDWDLATTIPRSDPMLGAFADQLGLSDAQVDAMFIEGKSL